MVTVYHSDSIKIILRPGSCIDLWQIKSVQKYIYIYILLVTSKPFTDNKYNIKGLRNGTALLH